MEMGEFADAAGISYVYLSAIERDVKTPSIEVLWDIAQALGANAQTIAQMFEAAGYGDFWQAVGETASVSRGGVPSIDTFVNNSDELRTDEARRMARDFLHMVSRDSFAEEARAHEAAAKDRA